MRECSPSSTYPTSAFTVPAESAVATRRAQDCGEKERADILASAPAIPVTALIRARPGIFLVRSAPPRWECALE